MLYVHCGLIGTPLHSDSSHSKILAGPKLLSGFLTSVSAPVLYSADQRIFKNFESIHVTCVRDSGVHQKFNLLPYTYGSLELDKPCD